MGERWQSDHRHCRFPSRAALAAALLAILALSGCADFRLITGDQCGASVSWSCVTPKPVSPAAPAAGTEGKPNDPVAAAYDRRFRALLAADRVTRIRMQTGYGYDSRDLSQVAGSNFRDEYRTLDRLAAETRDDRFAAVPVDGGHAGGARTFTRRWRTARSDLYLGAPDNDGHARTFEFSGLQALNTEIVPHLFGTKSAVLTGSCDGAMVVEAGLAKTEHLAGARFETRVNGGDITLRPAQDLTRCEFRVSPSGGAPYPLTVLREETAHPRLAELDSRYQVCAQPRLTGLSRLERAFATSRWLSQTCPFPVGHPVLLDDQRAGFDAKVEALLGTRLPARFYDEVNPELPLDFSHAPHPSLIVISYLDFKADFSGRVIERLLRYHASRGVKIRITVTRILLRDKDARMLEGLAAEYPNVQLQEFSWEAPSGGQLADQAAHFHRTHHAKMLAVLSPNPAENRAIFGGRNIHDGFLFSDEVDLSRFPDLNQYQGADEGELNYFANYNDFEVKFTDPAVVRLLAEHFATLWHADADTGMIRPFSVPVEDGAPSRLADGTARHFISAPYADGKALERYYADLIDAAQTSIEIVNPYLNFPPLIAEAFDRALKRGVDVTIIGRINLNGDLGGKVLTELNEEFVKKYADRIRLYEYRNKKLLLHAKLMMIDGRLVTVSSVNLNHRSFIFDSENGIAVLDRGFYKRMKQIFESYRASAVRLTSDVTIPLPYRILLSIKIIRDTI